MARYLRIGFTRVGTTQKDWCARQSAPLPNVSAIIPIKTTISSMAPVARSNARIQDVNVSISTTYQYMDRRTSNVAVNTLTSSTRERRKIVKAVHVKHSHLLGHAPVGINLVTTRQYTTKSKRRKRRDKWSIIKQEEWSHTVAS